MAEQTATEANKPAAKKSDTVKVRVRYGRVLVRADKVEDSLEPLHVYAEKGEEIVVPRKWAEQILGRALEGYPAGTGGAPGRTPGYIIDPPVELVQ